MTETTTTTTTVRRVVRRPKPRLVKRVRKVVIRTSGVKGAKVVRRPVGARPAKSVQIIDVTPVRELPMKQVSALTVKERKRLPVPR